jgi:hypothetical protein
LKAALRSSEESPRKLRSEIADLEPQLPHFQRSLPSRTDRKWQASARSSCRTARSHRRRRTRNRPGNRSGRRRAKLLKTAELAAARRQTAGFQERLGRGFGTAAPARVARIREIAAGRNRSETERDHPARARGEIGGETWDLCRMSEVSRVV